MNGDVLHKAPLGATGVPFSYIGIGGSYGPHIGLSHLAVAGGYAVYANHGSPGSIAFMRLGDPIPAKGTIVADTSEPRGFALVDGFAYFTSNPGVVGSVRRVGIPSGTVTTIVDGLVYPRSIALDAKWIYIAQASASVGSIAKVARP